MIIDTSALVAIFLWEPEVERFTRMIQDSAICRISAANFVELSMVLERQLGPKSVERRELFFQQAEIVIEPVSVQQAYLARQAFLDYGKGRHPAGLNFGDCFAYALAKTMSEPLLFKGDDFRKTDIRSVA